MFDIRSVTLAACLGAAVAAQLSANPKHVGTMGAAGAGNTQSEPYDDSFFDIDVEDRYRADPPSPPPSPPKPKPWPDCFICD